MLGVDAELDGMPFGPYLPTLWDRHLLPGGYPELFLDDIDPGHQLGHRVLDLDSGVHFHEEETTVLGEEELDRAGVFVPCGAGRSHRRLTHLGPKLCVEGDRWRLLDDFLVAPLDRAFALAEVDHPALRISENLKLDVSWSFEILFEVEGRISKCPFRLVPSGVIRFLQLVRIPGQAHPSATTAGRRFEDHRKADLLGKLQRLIARGERTVRTGQDWHLGGRHGSSSLGFVTHEANGLGRGSDEGEAALADDLGEMRVFGQKPVSGVNRVRTGDPGGRHHRGHVEVRARRVRRTDAHRLVGEHDVEAVPVGIGMYRHRRNAELAAGGDDSYRDLSPIGYQDF